MGYDESLYMCIKECVKALPDVTERKMFGGVAFMYKGNMFCGPTDSRLMVRVGKERYEDMLKKEHVREMDFTGRPLKGFVYVDSEALKSQDAVCKWIDEGLEFVKTLPSK